MAEARCFNCAYFLTEENGEDVCMCAASPFIGKERDSVNMCDYFAQEKFKEDCLNCQHCNKGFFTDQGICVCKESPCWQHMRMGKDIIPCKFFEVVNVRKE